MNLLEKVKFLPNDFCKSLIFSRHFEPNFPIRDFSKQTHRINSLSLYSQNQQVQFVLIGRETEKEILLSALGSEQSELIAVYGRRVRKNIPY